MSSNSRKRKSTSPSPGDPPSAKRQSHNNRRDLFGKCVCVPSSSYLCVLNGVYRSSTYCSECNSSYMNERSHRAVCTRKEVSCVYPDPNSEGRGRSFVLRRVDGYFKCIRCGKPFKKDQNMKACLSQIEQHRATLIFIRTMLANVTATAVNYRNIAHLLQVAQTLPCSQGCFLLVRPPAMARRSQPTLITLPV